MTFIVLPIVEQLRGTIVEYPRNAFSERRDGFLILKNIQDSRILVGFFEDALGFPQTCWDFQGSFGDFFQFYAGFVSGGGRAYTVLKVWSQYSKKLL